MNRWMARVAESPLGAVRAARPDQRTLSVINRPPGRSRGKASLRTCGYWGLSTSLKIKSKFPGVASRVKLLIGDALEMLAATPGKFDLIFNDVDKSQYPEVLRMALPRLRTGGLFITDNVLWYGRTARPAPNGDEATRAIQRFNRLLYKTPGLFTTILPLRDGFAVAMRES